MGMMEIRHRILLNPPSQPSNVIYYGQNLVCDGTNFYDTGFAPFSADNANVDFKITMVMTSFERDDTLNPHQETAFCAKYEGNLSGQSYPGFVVRHHSASGWTGTLDVGGYNYYIPSIAETLNKTFTLWRQSGVYKCQIEGLAEQTLQVRVATFNQNLLIGAAQKTNGDKFRYGICTFDYFKLELI